MMQKQPNWRIIIQDHTKFSFGMKFSIELKDQIVDVFNLRVIV